MTLMMMMIYHMTPKKKKENKMVKILFILMKRLNKKNWIKSISSKMAIMNKIITKTKIYGQEEI